METGSLPLSGVKRLWRPNLQFVLSPLLFLLQLPSLNRSALPAQQETAVNSLISRGWLGQCHLIPSETHEKLSSSRDVWSVTDSVNVNQEIGFIVFWD